MRRFVGLAVVASFAIATLARAADVEVKQTTYAELEKAIQQHKGKVVMVDVWSLS